MAQDAQEDKTAAGQGAEQNEKGLPVFCGIQVVFPALPALQLVEEQLLVLQPLDQEVGAPDRPLAGAAHLTDQGVVGAVLPNPLHPPNLVRPGGQIGIFRQLLEKLLHLHRGGGVGENVPAVIDQGAGVHGKKPVPLHPEKDGGVPDRAPPQPQGQKDGQGGDTQTQAQREQLHRGARGGQPHRTAAGEQHRQRRDPQNPAQGTPAVPALFCGVR